jgi:hypothetical protein
MAETLDSLLAKQEITEVIYRYCRAYDRMDAELALSCWHEGGTVAYGSRYNGTIGDYIGPSWAHRWKLANFSHQVTNVLIAVNGERAGSEAYVTASLQAKPNDDGIIIEDLWRGRYLDRWSRRDGRWAIEHRHFIPDSFTQIKFPASALPKAELGLARYDQTDPSYAILNP